MSIRENSPKKDESYTSLKQTSNIMMSLSRDKIKAKNTVAYIYEGMSQKNTQTAQSSLILLGDLKFLGTSSKLGGCNHMLRAEGSLVPYHIEENRESSKILLP